MVSPRAPGQGIINRTPESELRQNPSAITISLAEGIDRIAEPRYLAEPVAVDGYLDLAVLRITRTVGGSLIGEGEISGLSAVPIGSTDEVESGDPIRILGYPGLARSNAATLTTGTVASPVQDPRLGSNRAFVNLDADVRPGNSGGLVADGEGRIIGVPTLNWIEGADSLGAMRPIGFAAALIEAATAGEPYQSDFVTSPTGEEEFTRIRVGQSTITGLRSDCDVDSAGLVSGSTNVTLLLSYSGFAEGAHQDLAIEVYEEQSGTHIRGITTADEWPFTFSQSGCFTTAIELSHPIDTGLYYFDVFVGPNYRFSEALSFEFEHT